MTSLSQSSKSMYVIIVFFKFYYTILFPEKHMQVSGRPVSLWDSFAYSCQFSNWAGTGQRVVVPGCASSACKFMSHCVVCERSKLRSSRACVPGRVMCSSTCMTLGNLRSHRAPSEGGTGKLPLSALCLENSDKVTICQSSLDCT